MAIEAAFGFWVGLLIRVVEPPQPTVGNERGGPESKWSTRQSSRTLPSCKTTDAEHRFSSDRAVWAQGVGERIGTSAKARAVQRRY
jgi:hypothetical protein